MRHDMMRTAFFVAVAIALSFGFPASAGDPSAIVEDIDAPGAKLRFMDYVEPGHVSASALRGPSPWDTCTLACTRRLRAATSPWAANKAGSRAAR